MPKKGELIELGFQIPLENDEKCVVEEFLGGGGQGEVYKVSIGGAKYALKWYHDRCQTTDLRESLRDLIKMGAPSKAFLWPIRLIEFSGKFGYTMGLRPKEYEKSQGILSRKINLSYLESCTACLQLADAFRQLHSKGLSYQDISWGNVFINPKSGDVLICDNDNVAPHGASVAGIAGTLGFMAPEIVRGKARPDIYTDAFSLAVLLFRMLLIEHPFDGSRYSNEECLDDAFRKKIYGENPIYIFDPSGKNPPCPDTQKNAELFKALYPQHLMDLFMKTFTEGIKDRENGRVRELEWIEAFRTIRDKALPCPSCNTLLNYDVLKGNGGICFKCKNKATRPPCIRFMIRSKERTVVLNPDTKLRAYQIDKIDDVYEGDNPIGVMAQNPNDPKVWGLRNLTNDNWFYSVNDAEEKTCVPQKTVILTKGLKINFGTATGEIVL